MWRPFIGTLTDKTYESFLSKQNRLSTAPPKSYTIHKQGPIPEHPRSLSSDNTLRLQQFQVLKEKVKNQRLTIRLLDKKQQLRNTQKFSGFKSQREEERHKKFEENEKIRSFSNNKAKKPKALNAFSNKSIDEFYDKSFTENIIKLNTPKRVKRKEFKIVYKIPKRKSQESLKELQDRLIKELKISAPNYYKDTKQEFMKIREQCEMTYQQYLESRRLKRKDPYKLFNKTVRV